MAKRKSKMSEGKQNIIQALLQDKEVMTRQDTVTVSVKVKNIGEVEGIEAYIMGVKKIPFQLLSYMLR